MSLPCRSSPVAYVVLLLASYRQDTRRERRERRGASVSCVFAPRPGPEDSPKKFLGSIRSRARASNTNTVPVRRASAFLSSGERRASVTWNLRNSNIPLREKGREGKGVRRRTNGRKIERGRKSHLFRAFRMNLLQASKTGSCKRLQYCRQERFSNA